MSNVLQISRNLWQLKMGRVNAYLLETDDGLVLVDAGWPNKTDTLFKAVQDSRHDPKKIRHLVLTHGHIDHAGSAAEVLRRTGATSYAHTADLDLINEGKAWHLGTSVTPGIIPTIGYFLFIKPARNPLALLLNERVRLFTPTEIQVREIRSLQVGFPSRIGS